MNKKGYLAFIMSMVVLIGVGIIFTQVAKKMDATDRKLGEIQYPLVRLNAHTRMYEAFVQEAALDSLEGAIGEIAWRPEFLGLPGPKRYTPQQYCPVLNTAKDPTTIRYEPNFDLAIKKAFNQYMDGSLKLYAEIVGWDIPLDNFEVYAEKGKFTGVAVMPTIMPITFQKKQIGTAAFRPSFQIEYDHGFEDYPEIFSTLNWIAQRCSETEKPSECDAIKDLPKDWKIESGGPDFYEFYIPRGKQPKPPLPGQFACYTLYLPPESAVPTT